MWVKCKSCNILEVLHNRILEVKLTNIYLVYALLIEQLYNMYIIVQSGQLYIDRKPINPITKTVPDIISLPIPLCNIVALYVLRVFALKVFIY